jgi:hypothetical protein
VKRTESVAVAFWVRKFEELRTTRTKHDFFNLIEMTGRILVGLSAEDMLEEALFTLRKLELEGVVRNVVPAGESYYWATKFRNLSFEFTRPALQPRPTSLLGRVTAFLSPGSEEASPSPSAVPRTVTTVLHGKSDDLELRPAFAFGGFSKVHRAVRVRGGDDLVVKIADDKPYARARMDREIAFLLSSKNERFVPILEVDPGKRWFAMPEAIGDLWKVRNLVIGVEKNIRVVIEQVGRALDALHALGFAHRDVAPGNILFLDDRWVLADFGCISRGRDDIPDETVTTGLGTAGWASPEAYVDARNAMHENDFYSLGRVLSWLVSGEVPVHGEPSPSPYGPFAAAISRATHADPAQRVHTFSDFWSLIS